MERVLKIALDEVGYLEKASNSKLDDKTANAGNKNYTKYGRDMHAIYPSVMDFPAAWCDCFVDWCFYKAYGLANAKSLLAGDFNDYTVASAQLYKNKNAWYTSNPKKGDQIFFKNSTRICHTGLVYDVDNKYVYTIEGNTSNGSEIIANGGAVCKKKYLLTNSRIAGYGRPNYSIVNEATLQSAQQKLKEALKIENGNATLADAQAELKAALKIDTNTSVNHSGKTELPTSVTKPITSTKNDIVAQGQQHSINFVGYKIIIDGVRGNDTAIQGRRVLQQALNLDYKAGLVLDGVFKTKSKSALGNHYVKKGETQYMVTALEILLMLKGYNPNGVESPGVFGSGLEACVKQYQRDNGLTVDGVAGRNTFLSLIS